VHPNGSPDGLQPALLFLFVIPVPDYCGDSQYLYFSEKSEKSNQIQNSGEKILQGSVGQSGLFLSSCASITGY
jgi:hypothetical protein